MKVLLPLLCTLCAALCIDVSYAQALKNIKAQAEGDLVIITYDLEAPDNNQKFNVELYSSHDNYRNPLRYLQGDYGDNVLPGKNKRIEWNAKSELNSYQGNVTFEVRATMAMPALRFTNPAAGTKFKRGKAYTIAWEGSGVNENSKVQLYNNGAVSQTIGQAGNERRVTWVVPDGMALGKNYSIRLVNGTDEIASSPEFAIGRKIPLGLKIVPVIAVGAVAYLILGNSTIENEPLPEPPGAPNE